MVRCASTAPRLVLSNSEDVGTNMGTAVEITTRSLLPALIQVRRQSLELCRPLSPEDMMVQSCAEASPAKWHLAHTTWFFETFVLREFLPAYQPFHPDFLWLFNSYYNDVSGQPEKKLRASFSRPSLDQVLAYRTYVEDALTQLEAVGMPEEAVRRIELGIHHEQQHQELLCYDIKHALWTNPLHPAYLESDGAVFTGTAAPLHWIEFPGGVKQIGHSGPAFAYDNELPRHHTYLEPYALAARLVTCAEYRAFLEDGGYQRPELWLADGWDTVQAQQWQAPLYWRKLDGEWMVYTLRGLFLLSTLAATPVCHISYYEADAYARWAQKRLPTEAEWEFAAAADQPSAAAPPNLLESGFLHPTSVASEGRGAEGLQQMFGDLWEWTRSAYLGYPGYHAPSGALGEYNGKFMSNQMVLRGGSAVTPASHIRSTYRNFFSPATRWQFAGLRLAQDPSPARGKDASR
jgi:ergothioneine biosynthesis protein EgtB